MAAQKVTRAALRAAHGARTIAVDADHQHVGLLGLQDLGKSLVAHVEALEFLEARADAHVGERELLHDMDGTLKREAVAVGGVLQKCDHL